VDIAISAPSAAGAYFSPYVVTNWPAVLLTPDASSHTHSRDVGQRKVPAQDSAPIRAPNTHRYQNTVYADSVLRSSRTVTMARPAQTADATP